MNRFILKSLLLIIFTLCLSKEVSAQNDLSCCFSSGASASKDYLGGWIFEVGVNVTDSRNIQRSLFLKDHFGPTEWSQNFFPARLAAERILGYKGSVQVAVTTNQLNTINQPDDTKDDPISYLAIDFSYKYQIVGISPFRRLRPYILGGVSFQSVDEDLVRTKWGVPTNNSAPNQVVLHAGFGANFWFSEVFGLNFQSIYKHQFNGYADFHQHSLGLVVRVVPGGFRSSKRLWDFKW